MKLFTRGGSGPYLKHASLGPRKSAPNGISISSAVLVCIAVRLRMLWNFGDSLRTFLLDLSNILTSRAKLHLSPKAVTITFVNFDVPCLTAIRQLPVPLLSLSSGNGRISTHADPTSTRRANLIGTRLRYVFLYTELYFRVGGRFVRFWASGEQSSSKWEIPCSRSP